MTILCKLCKRALHSHKPDNEAQADVMQQMSQHLGDTHLAQTQKLAAAIGLASSYLLLTHFVDIPESELAFIASYQQCRADLIEVLKVGPGEIPLPAPRAPKSGILH